MLSDDARITRYLWRGHKGSTFTTFSSTYGRTTIIQKVDSITYFDSTLSRINVLPTHQIKSQGDRGGHTTFRAFSTSVYARVNQGHNRITCRNYSGHSRDSITGNVVNKKHRISRLKKYMHQDKQTVYKITGRKTRINSTPVTPNIHQRSFQLIRYNKELNVRASSEFYHLSSSASKAALVLVLNSQPRFFAPIDGSTILRS